MVLLRMVVNDAGFREGAALEVHLKEFERLRAEIDNRSLLQHGIIAADLAAIAAGFGVVAGTPEALIGVAAVTTYLWLLWMDHTLGIAAAASYIRDVLAVKLSAIVGAPVLGWEAYPRPDDGFPTPFSAIPLLFRYGVPALLVFYVLDRVHGGAPTVIDAVRAAAVLAVAVAHGFVWLKVYRPLRRAGKGAGNIGPSKPLEIG